MKNQTYSHPQESIWNNSRCSEKKMEKTSIVSSENWYIKQACSFIYNIHILYVTVNDVVKWKLTLFAGN